MSVSVNNKAFKQALIQYNTVVESPSRPMMHHYNYKNAFELFNKLPDNLLDKHYYLFECYLYGRGVAQDKNIADEHLKKCLSGEKKHPLALLHVAKIMESENEEKKYDRTIIRQITSIYQLAIKLSEGTKLITCIQFNFLLFMIDTYHIEKSASDELKYKISILKLAEVLALLHDYPPARSLFADIISGKSEIEGIVELYKKNIKPYEIETLIITNYLLAAIGGELEAARGIAEYYHKIGDNEEMTWWYWWAKYNNKGYKNQTILSIIKNSSKLRVSFEKMSKDTEEILKKSNDPRAREQLKKELFIDEVDIRKDKMLKYIRSLKRS